MHDYEEKMKVIKERAEKEHAERMIALNDAEQERQKKANQQKERERLWKESTSHAVRVATDWLRENLGLSGYEITYDDKTKYSQETVTVKVKKDGSPSHWQMIFIMNHSNVDMMINNVTPFGTKSNTKDLGEVGTITADRIKSIFTDVLS